MDIVQDSSLLGKTHETPICPKRGKPAWAPYEMKVTKKYGQVYRYQVYRHPDGRRKSPRKHTVRTVEGSTP